MMKQHRIGRGGLLKPRTYSPWSGRDPIWRSHCRPGKTDFYVLDVERSGVKEMPFVASVRRVRWPSWEYGPQKIVGEFRTLRAAQQAASRASGCRRG